MSLLRTHNRRAIRRRRHGSIFWFTRHTPKVTPKAFSWEPATSDQVVADMRAMVDRLMQTGRYP